MRVLIMAAVLLAVAVPVAAGFDPAYEAKNYGKINERAAVNYTPEFNQQLAEQGVANQNAANQIEAADGPTREYGREFDGNLCSKPMNGCAGDVRLYHWGEQGYGIVRPILFTARNGSTLSGHVWMTKAGPAKRPGVVITNGSVQAPESLYWYAAETLAKAGYVVMTWDPQGQGLSDTFGEGDDRLDGVPSQSGEPFYDGTEDALDFFFSTPAKPYAPRNSCSSNTSHIDKQVARVKSNRASAYNPFAASLDTDHVGLVGHSLGASAVSYVGQLDPRVKAIVAYDNLADVTKPTKITCPSGSSKRPATVPITKPALGMSADYGLTPTPYASDPSQSQIDDKHAGSLAASAAGVDTGEIMIRGGTHYEFSFIPNQAFGATARGMDMVSWYTTAWMDRELKGDPTATARLETPRWRDDAIEKTLDTDGNLYSAYYQSRLDLPGTFVCEDLRTGCPGQADDGRPPNYSFLETARTDDEGAPVKGSTTAPAGSKDTPPAATGKSEPTPDVPPPANADCGTASASVAVVHRSRHGLRIAGFAKGCVRRVQVSVARRTGARCRFATGTGLTRAAACSGARYLSAKGTETWVVKPRGVPTSGRYLIRVRAIAANGHKSRAASKRVQLK